MISYKEFEVISAIIKGKTNAESIYKNMPYYVFKSEDEVKGVLSDLKYKGYILNDNISKSALEEMNSLKVNNAIILAAGGADITAKSVYSMPKGLFEKNGETLIERQIKQLKEVGINDITVVVGYKQEMYFFLQDKWGVNLVVNPDLKKNNIYSLYMCVDKLNNTYICNCDNYFEENPFSAYEYNSYHSTVYKEDAHNELVVDRNMSGRIVRVYSGEESGECIYGHAYIDQEFSKRLVKFLNKEIDDFRISALFWEEFVSRHVEDLDMYVRQYPANYVYEFDTIQEIQNIDGLFLDSVSEKINKKICDVLNCKKNDIRDIVILQKGLSNILFTFVVKDEKYIFRFPGDSTSFFIYRKNEVRAQQLAAKACVDNTYVYIDESGTKISKFRENCKNLNGIYYRDIELMKRLSAQIRKFHDEGIDMPDWEEFNYDPVYQCERLMQEASKMKGNLFEIFKKEWEQVRLLQKYADKDGIKHTMCHNDINGDNCLLTDTTFDVIDWEFAGYNDPGYDFGRVIIDYDLDSKEIDEILEAYFGRPATSNERLHFISYAGIHCWYYVGWALYKESINESSRDWMIFFYKQSKRVFDYAIPKYREIYGEIN